MTDIYKGVAAPVLPKLDEEKLGKDLVQYLRNLQVFTDELLWRMKQSSIIDIVFSKTPASATAIGKKGEIAWDASYFYVCTSNNVWRRVAHASW